MVKGGDGACLLMRCFGRAADDAAIPGVRIRGALTREMPLPGSTSIPLSLCGVSPTQEYLLPAFDARL